MLYSSIKITGITILSYVYPWMYEVTHIFIDYCIFLNTTKTKNLHLLVMKHITVCWSHIRMWVPIIVNLGGRIINRTFLCSSSPHPPTYIASLLWDCFLIAVSDCWVRLLLIYLGVFFIKFLWCFLLLIFLHFILLLYFIIYFYITHSYFYLLYLLIFPLVFLLYTCIGAHFQPTPTTLG